MIMYVCYVSSLVKFFSMIVIAADFFTYIMINGQKI